MIQNNIIYTIGHGLLEYDVFFSYLHQYNINVLVDVRYIPYSKYATAYNKEKLEHISSSYTLQYLYMGDSLGSIAFLPEYKCGNHILYDKRAKEESFIHAINRLMHGITKGYTIVLMCAEYEAHSCHRHLLLAKALQERDINVMHIMKEGNVVPSYAYPFPQQSLFFY